MDIKKVQPGGKKSFTLESGKLLIADAYYLGYSELVLIEIDRQINNSRRRVVYFQRGVVYSYPEDSLWNVYRTSNGLWIARTNSDPIEKEIRKKHFGPAGWMIPITDEQVKEEAEKSKTVEQELRNTGFLFTASTDICTLLIGDQEIFSIPEKEFSLPGGYAKDMRDYMFSKFRENHELVAHIEPGEYSCRSKWNGLEVNLL